MRRSVLLFLFTLALLPAKAQEHIVLGEIDMGLLFGYHTLVTDPGNFILGEEYELGGYLQDLDHGGLIAVTTSYIRNGAYGTQYFILPNPDQPGSGYALGKLTTAKIKAGKLWELSTFDVLATLGFGWIHGADWGTKTGMADLIYVDPEFEVNTFSIPISIDLQWYGFDGSINSIGIKYDINGWNNFLGMGFTYLF